MHASRASTSVARPRGSSRAIVRNRVHRVHLPGLQLAAPRTGGAGEHASSRCNTAASAPASASGARSGRCKRWVWAIAWITSPTSSPGGQQQRAWPSRALVTDPPVLLADEPTGNLDTRTSLEVLALLQRLNRERGITIILVTHERDIAACASRVVTMRDGRIVSDVVQDQPMDAASELAQVPPPDASAGSSASDASSHSLSTAARIGPRVPFGVFFMMLLGEWLGEGLGACVPFVLDMSLLKVAWLPLLAGEIVKTWVGARCAKAAGTTDDQRPARANGAPGTPCPSAAS